MSKVIFNENDEPIPRHRKEHISLWNQDQPEFGPVWHKRVNFTDIVPPEVCIGAGCKHCKATRLYTEFLRGGE